ncbi:MAG TPA: DNA polymerase III subunit alpha [Ignavibacteria bacterium]|jgi:DNA polymerase-3 subunit alpha
MNFIHLHNHTHYSLLDGACTVDDLINAAVENNMNAVAITDHGVMYGAIEFYKKAKKANIKPIIGCEVYIITRGSRFDKEKVIVDKSSGKKKHYHHLILLAKNNEGYKNLCKISSIGHLEGFYYKPRIDLEVLKQYSKGLVATSACIGGVVAAHLVNGDYDLAKEDAIIYKEIFGDDFYLEIQNHNIEREKNVLEGMPKLSKELGIKLVATNDSHYIKKEHAIAHNVYLLIPESSVNTVLDYKTLKYGTDQIYFKSQEEMIDLFKNFPQAIESTLEIADKCNLKLDLDKNYVPDFPIPPDSGVSNLDDYFVKLAKEGLERRFKKITPDIEERFNFEIEIIKKMGYSGYFLIVQDFINSARKLGISVGPGRGSAAGSIVSYALGITNLNPLDYDLLFERFLNPDRVSMPDIDVDFADDKREEVINYVRQKYGSNSVGQIITFGKLSGRAVIKDVGRVLGIPLSTVDSITKQIPVIQGKVMPIDEAVEKIPELKWVKESTDPKIKELIEYSKILEGLNRNSGTHAAGVVIVPGNLIDYVPLYKTPAMPEPVTQFNMKDLETAGLLKMDFLGLKTLTIIENTIKLIEKNHRIKVDIDNIPLDDEKTFDLFGKGQTVGVFQFESTPMQEYLKKLKPTCIEDLVAMNALYRPGPMDMINDFIARKQGKQKIEYLHPKLERILKPTYGIMVYQEQVMQIANELAGFSLAEADLMRRAMGKKDAKLMEEQGKAFIKGAIKKGVDEKVANDIFEMIKKFASYGFNKSHSVAYSLIAYQTAYLKANYPTEFMTANLSNEIGDTDKIVLFIDDCRKLNIKVLPPDVNESDIGFTCVNNEIRFGLEAIKNVGENAVREIIAARNKYGKFQDLFHFCEKVDLRVVNKKTIESLILAGAMDSLGTNRSQMFNSIERAIQYGQNKKEEELRGQESLFSGGTNDKKKVVLDTAPVYQDIGDDWGFFEKLSKEKSVLGFYLSAHPLDNYRNEIEFFNNIHLANPDELQYIDKVKVFGVVTDFKTKIDKKGNTMAFFSIEDFSGKGECIIFSDAYNRYKDLIHIDAIIGVIGKGESAGNKVRVFVDEVITLQKLNSSQYVSINIFPELLTEKEILQCKKILESHSGKCPVLLKILNGSANNDKLYRSRKYFVTISDELISSLKKIFGEDNVLIINKN